jgi:hypothetical protein
VQLLPKGAAFILATPNHPNRGLQRSLDLNSTSSSTLILDIAMADHANTRSNTFRKPRRVTITIPHATYLELQRRSDEQGRSLSNLSAYLLECAVSSPLEHQPMLIPSGNGAKTTSLRVR